MPGVRLTLTGPLGEPAHASLADLGALLAVMEPDEVELFFVARCRGPAELLINARFSETRQSDASLQFRTALLKLEGEFSFDCDWVPDQQLAHCRDRFTLLHVRHDELALPSGRPLSLVLPIAAAAGAHLRQARLVQVDAAYSARFRRRDAAPERARGLVPALAELTERAPGGAAARAVRRTFDTVRTRGWTVREELGVEQPAWPAQQSRVHALLHEHLAKEFGFVPPQLWRLGASSADGSVPEEEDVDPLSDCREPGYLTEVIETMLPAGEAPASPGTGTRNVSRPAARPLDLPEGTPYVFLSYAHADQELLARIRARLGGQGIAHWHDSGISPGAVWDESLEARIRGASAFLACVTEHYQVSRYCRRELKFADLLHKPIVPVAPTACVWAPGLSMMFQEIQIQRLDVPGGWNEACAAITRALTTRSSR